MISRLTFPMRWRGRLRRVPGHCWLHQLFWYDSPLRGTLARWRKAMLLVVMARPAEESCSLKTVWWLWDAFVCSRGTLVMHRRLVALADDAVWTSLSMLGAVRKAT